MENQIAIFEEQIKSRTISAGFMEFNFKTNFIKCPNCGADTVNFNDYHGGEIYCQHCGKNLSFIDFYAKKKFNRTPAQFKPDEYKGLIAAICGYLGIETNFKPARVDGTPLAETKKLFGENATEFFKNKFPAFTAENQKFQNRKTGFCNLDAFQNFQPGIYILGGLPSLGKTTFALQLLNQLAHSIYCSFEMSSGFLYSKLLAQEINLLENGGINPETQNFNRKSDKFIKASDIVFGNFKHHEEEYKTVMKNFEENPLPLYIWEIAEIDLNKILNRIKQIADTLEKPPVICLDYLQLLTGATDNQKSALDDTLRQLFNFRRETNTTFIIISSLNRANYQTEISFESFCGSGGIEYSADVIFGLQLKLDKRTHEDAEKAKKQIPREIELKCLKNRFGANYDVGFFYYPNMEIFLPMLEYGEIVITSKGKGVPSRAED